MGLSLCSKANLARYGCSLFWHGFLACAPGTSLRDQFSFFQGGYHKGFHPNSISKVSWSEIFFKKYFLVLKYYYVVGTPNLKILLPSLHFFTRWQLVIWQTDHVGKPTLWLYSSSSAAAARLPLRPATFLVSLDFCNSIEHSNSWKVQKTKDQHEEFISITYIIFNTMPSFLLLFNLYL